jgi:hypothetical protein
MASMQTKRSVASPLAGQSAPPAATSAFLPNRIRPAPEKTAASFTPDRISAASEIKQIARAGVQGRGGKLPHLARIQPALEKHDLGGVRAFTDSHAAAACRALGAEAYTFGNRVAFKSNHPSLHTAAHEAAHTVQQGSGIGPAGGIGREGDRFEKEADQAAAAVRRRTGAGDAFAGGRHAPVAQAAPSKHMGIEAVQLQTEITGATAKMTYDTNEEETVGYRMLAKLDPSDPAQGSAPGANEQKELMAYLKQRGFKSLIRGHLMNGQLGGPGIAPNLFPITSQANSQHKYFVENHVKELVTKGLPVAYRVEVKRHKGFDADGSSISADFKCQYKAFNPRTKNVVEQNAVTVRSEPELGSKGSAETFETDDPDEQPESLAFSSNQLKKGWGEFGKGQIHGTHYSAK